MTRFLLTSILLVQISFSLVNAQAQIFPLLTAGDSDGLLSETLAFQAQSPLPKTVLVLFPYQADLPQTVLAQQALREEFGNAADLKLDLYYEYMDLNRFSDAVYQQQLADLYKTKYHQKPVDLVLVLNERTLDFWLQHRAEILPDTPVVVFDILPKPLAALQLPPDVTGLVSLIDDTQSLRWLGKALPAVTEVVVVGGVGPAEQEFNTPIEVLKASLDGQVQLTDWSHLPLAEIKRRAAALPPTAVIFYQLMFEDAAGVKYRPIDVLRELVSVSAVPVISKYDQFIGLGTIGGYMFSIEQEARSAAQLGLRILRGEAASSIPISSILVQRFIFDHLALQRWAIPLSALPAESIIKNRQYTLWEQYRLQLIALGVGVGSLAVLAAFLAVLTRRLSATRLALSRLNVSLESQVQERTTDLSQANSRLEAEITERKQAETERERLILELQEALSKVQQLEGILPICGFCKKIRDENGDWHMMEDYISHHTRAQFSHGFCPECGRKYYGDLMLER